MNQNQTQIPNAAGSIPAQPSNEMPPVTAEPMRSEQEKSGEIPSFEMPVRNSDGCYPGNFNPQ